MSFWRSGLDAIPSPLKSSGSADEELYYFAYGSNLHLAQMSRRCTGSTFLGKATLPGHRWQINQRGYANIVASKESYVEGFVYCISRNDEKSLDLFEGVSSGAYEKHYLRVDLEPVREDQYFKCKSGYVAQMLDRERSFLKRKPSQDAGAYTGMQQSSLPEDAHSKEESLWPVLHRSELSRNGHEVEKDTRDPSHNLLYATAGRTAGKLRTIKVLIYISTKFTRDGIIGGEYLQRMELARSDAITLGISQSFIEHNMDPFIRGTAWLGRISATPAPAAQSKMEASNDGQSEDQREATDPR